MNICFIKGKAVSKVEFKFIYNSSNISIAYCNIEVTDKNIVKIIGYNEIADFMYRSLKVNDITCIAGKLNSNMDIEIEEIYV